MFNFSHSKWCQTWNRCSLPVFLCGLVMDGKFNVEKKQTKKTQHKTSASLFLSPDGVREAEHSDRTTKKFPLLLSAWRKVHNKIYCLSITLGSSLANMQFEHLNTGQSKVIGCTVCRISTMNKRSNSDSEPSPDNSGGISHHQPIKMLHHMEMWADAVGNLTATASEAMQRAQRVTVAETQVHLRFTQTHTHKIHSHFRSICLSVAMSTVPHNPVWKVENSYHQISFKRLLTVASPAPTGAPLYKRGASDPFHQFAHTV